VIGAFEEAARSLGSAAMRVEVEDDRGRAVVTSTVSIEGIRITAIERQGFLQLVCAEKMDAIAAGVILRAPPDVRSGLLAALQLEGSGGRTTCHVVEGMDSTGVSSIEVLVEQRVFLVDGSPPSLQRVVDGLIEIGSRAARLRLKHQSLSCVQAARDWGHASGPHEAMYG
jgi:hypothetical protein